MMLISLAIFMKSKHMFPMPGRHEAVTNVDYTPEERVAMAKEIRQRMYALFAVLGISVFFWFSFHQNGQSLSFFARDFVKTDAIPPEIWQAVNPFFVIALTPLIMLLFNHFTKKRPPYHHSAEDCPRYGNRRTGLSPADGCLDSQQLSVGRDIHLVCSIGEGSG